VIDESASPEYPALYRSFDSCSGRFQSRFTLLTRISLIGTVAAGGGGAVSIAGSTNWPAVVALLAFLLQGARRIVFLRDRS
jgi:hypothetical protein